jgi:hypothetical protein
MVSFQRKDLGLACVVVIYSLFGQSCKNLQGHESLPGAYYENDVLWAFGKIKIGPPRIPGTINARRSDTASAKFTALVHQTSGIRQVAKSQSIHYADLHPKLGAEIGVLGYTYDYEFVPRVGSRSVIDVAAVLRRTAGGYSFDKQRRIILGYISDRGGDNFPQLVLAANLRVSEIVEGNYLGRWVIHPRVVEREEILETDLDCNDAKARSGQLSNQRTIAADEQFLCNLKPDKLTACDRDPLGQGCLVPEPQAKTALFSNFEQRGQVTGAIRRGVGVFQVVEGAENIELIFVSELQQYRAQDHADYCVKNFYAYSRTFDNYVHPSCELHLGPKPEQKEGFLSCLVSVKRRSVISYMEKPCEVTAVFKLDDGRQEDQVIQIIRL